MASRVRNDRHYLPAVRRSLNVAAGDAEVRGVRTRSKARNELQDLEWLHKKGGTVLPRKILGGREHDFSTLGFHLGPEIDSLFRESRLPHGWEMRPSEEPAWSLIYDGACDDQQRGRFGV